MNDGLEMHIKPTDVDGTQIQVVTLSGMLDGHTTISVEKELANLTEQATRLVIDLEGLTYIASAGIGLLLATRARLLENGGTCEICQAGDAVMEIFHVVGISDLVTIHESRAAALAQAAV